MHGKKISVPFEKFICSIQTELNELYAGQRVLNFCFPTSTAAFTGLL